MDNMQIYNAVRECPQNALRAITAGRLKGKSDINPMWRIKALTEQFGACGIGWFYEITKQWTEDGANGEKAAFVNINLYIKHGDEWSKPIQGTGGSAFIAAERNGLYTSDECYKMALTDAISVACKALGFAADVYWAQDNTKYNQQPAPQQPQQRQPAAAPPKKADAATIKLIRELIEATQSDTKKLLDFFKVGAIEEMTQGQANKCKAMLRSKQQNKPQEQQP